VTRTRPPRTAQPRPRNWPAIAPKSCGSRPGGSDINTIANGAAGRNGQLVLNIDQPRRATIGPPSAAADRTGKPAGAAGAAAPHGRPRPRVPDYVPFPTLTLPDRLASFVRVVAAAVGCDEANIALPVLAATAGAIGNTRQVRLKRGWTEPAVVWAALVGASGVRKSPPFRAAMRPLVEAEQEFRDRYREEMARYAALTTEQQKGEPEPVLRRVLTEDVTIESVATILAENPRGVINARDEVDDWFQSMTRYKGKQGGTDRGRWLKLSNADTLTVDRKTGEPHLRRLFIRIASCSLTGTIQPGILAASLDRMARASGLAARLLLAMPTARRTYWSEAEIDPETEAQYGALIRSLLGLIMTADVQDRAVPHVLNLTPEAKALWVPFYNRIQDEKADAEPDIAAVLAKLEGYAARFALIYHVATEAAAGRDALAPVPAAAVRAGIGLARWFADEARRIYLVLGESDEDRERRDLVEWVRARGGRCTPRDLQKARGGSFPTAEAAETGLSALVDAGDGVWLSEPNSRGGWTKKTFILNDSDTCDTRVPADRDRSGDASDTRADTRPDDPAKYGDKGLSVASVGVVNRDKPVVGPAASGGASVAAAPAADEEGDL
jgi:hypothetical protein